MYGKVFASMYEGTLYGQWEAIVTLQQLIVLANQDGVVDMTPPAIAARTSIPLDIIEKGLAILAQPDKYSRSPKDEGRRIVPLDPSRPWGWRLVNYSHYRGIRTADERREYQRNYYQQRKASTALNQSQPASTDSTDTYAEAEAYAEVEAEKDIRGDFACVRAEYPAGTYSESEWLSAEKACVTLAESKASWETLIAAAKAYRAQCEASGRIGTQYVSSPARFYGSLKWKGPFPLPKSKAQAAQDKNVAAVQEFINAG